jgi:hypothetical protein
MKAISVFDLRLVPSLAHLNHFEMCSATNDHLILPVLEEMGWDISKPLQYTVSQHRTLQNTIEVGFVIRGEISHERKHLSGVWADCYDKISCAAETDRSLCVEMAALMGASLNYDAFHTSREMSPNGKPLPFPAELSNPDESVISEQIKQLEGLLLFIRGDQYGKNGAHKTPQEYHETDVVVSKKKKRGKE